MMNEFACSIDQSKILVKGKRTKRQRPTSPYGGMASSSSINSTSPTSSTTTPSPLDVSESSEEDQDMANCLILLAQGDGDARKAGKNGHDGKNMDGNYVYECKTCNRTFPSFQALGGHRASHKKPKMMNLVEDQEILLHSTRDEIVMDKIYNPNTPSPSPAECSGKMFSKSSVHLLQINKKANKTHECLICRTVFTSGQALGGHMRRHRAPSTGAAASQISLSSSAVDSSASSSGLPEDAHDVQKPRNVLSLDLNLPAPEDDQRDTKFQFVAPQKSLVFTSPALVGCRY